MRRLRLANFGFRDGVIGEIKQPLGGRELRLNGPKTNTSDIHDLVLQLFDLITDARRLLLEGFDLFR